MSQINPTKKSNRFEALTEKWAIGDSLYGGVFTMRAAGKTYLPRNQMETEEDWAVRLQRAYLFNAYKRSIQQASGRVFQEDMVTKGYPVEIGVFQQDVDSQGRDITQFTKSVFMDALNRGISYILVEFPRVAEQPLTLADSLASGERPYWLHIQATQVLAVHSTQIGGTERVTHFRFFENVTEVSEDGLDETIIEQVKAFHQASVDAPVHFTIWRHTEKGWTVYDTGTLLGMPSIPVVPVYTNRIGFYLGSPPLMDLAEVNIAHWQSTAEQRNILHFARVPFLHVKGIKPGIDTETGEVQQMEIKVNGVLTAGDDAHWVETSGAGLAAGRADLVDLEQKMEQLGLTLTSPRSGNTTATENSINAAETNSLLKDMALSLADSLEYALYFTAFYLNTDPNVNGKVTISTKFAVDLTTSSTAQPAAEAAIA